NHYQVLGGTLKELGAHAEARALLDKALVSARELTRDFPGIPAHRHSLGGVFVSQATWHEFQGQLSAACDRLEQASVQHPAAHTVTPRHGRYRLDLQWDYWTLAKYRERLGRPGEAEKTLQQAIALWQQLAEECRDLSAYREDLAQHHVRL